MLGFVQRFLNSNQTLQEIAILMYGDYKPNEQSVHRKFLGNSRTYIRDIMQCSILSNVLGI